MKENIASKFLSLIIQLCRDGEKNNTMMRVNEASNVYNIFYIVSSYV